MQERHHFGLGEERDHQQRVQVQALAEHPKVRGHHEVLDEHVQQLAAQLKRARPSALGVVCFQIRNKKKKNSDETDPATVAFRRPRFDHLGIEWSTRSIGRLL